MVLLRLRLAVSVVLMTGMIAACSGSGRDPQGPAGDGVLVVATTSILGDVVENVAGDDATVEVLIPNGTDPHGFEPSARQMARLQSADLVVANGLGLEASLRSVLESLATGGPPLVEVAEEVDPLPFGHAGADGDEDDGADDHDGDDDHGDLDPHFWTDPLRVATAADVVAAALAEVASEVDWAGRARRYGEELEKLHRDIERILEEVPAGRRKLVTNHEVFGYFAARYGFEVTGVVIPGGTTIAEPSASDLAQLAATIREEHVPAVFGETTQSGDLVEALRREADLEVEVVPLFSEALGDAGSGADSYIGMMGVNARRIAEALG